ncbi:MAG: serine/threonine protein kinase [Saprospiraceae bacterium]|nr:serine/threonine protein kinase [Saprospiraceae bacterium]
MEITIPKKISQYSLLQKIGRGSTADVWSAKDQQDQYVALKIYSKIKHLDEVAYQLFNDEFEKTKLLSHPNVLRAQNFIIENDTPILAFPLYESCLEKEIIRRKIDNLEQNKDYPSSYSNEEILNIVKQVADGLSYLHANSIIHNDIKPANIVFRKTNEGQLQCSIIDFGISLDLKNYTKSAYKKDIASSKTVVYAAPEKINGINTEPKSDIFSLGMVILSLPVVKIKASLQGISLLKVAISFWKTGR